MAWPELKVGRGVDISIPVDFTGGGVRAFGADPPRVTPYLAGGHPLRVADGAGCNCPVFEFSAHLHGTHTECAGHIAAEPGCVQDVLPAGPFLRALLVTLSPESGGECGESYTPALREDDLVLTYGGLRSALGSPDCEALAIRTLPNGVDKRTRNYGERPAPFFTTEAMEFLSGLPLVALLVDLPSVDRADDDGLLSNHHRFWNGAESRTLTELIYVPDEVKDGTYLLSLNVSNLRSDAAPSRPVLYRMES